MEPEQHSDVSWAYKVIYEDLKACGCGIFETRMELLREALRDMPLYENERWRKYSDAAGEWFLCLLDGAGLIEHGGSIGGSWLTHKGKKFKSVLEDEKAWRALVFEDAPVGICPVENCKECKDNDGR